MKLPASILGQKKADQNLSPQHNLSLRSENGSINVSIKILDKRGDAVPTAIPRRTLILAESTNGRMNIKLVWSIWHSTPSLVTNIFLIPKDIPPTAAPLFFEIKGDNGSIHLQLPRTYHGLLKTRTLNGRLTCSDRLTAESTFVSDGEKHSRNFFIGDFPTEEFDGNEIVIRSENGSIKVRYLDDVEEDKSSRCCIQWDSLTSICIYCTIPVHIMDPFGGVWWKTEDSNNKNTWLHTNKASMICAKDVSVHAIHDVTAHWGHTSCQLKGFEGQKGDLLLCQRQSSISGAYVN